ncbi:MAG: tRNA (adenosine(37)-N6)-dimethylallyltransferase MiaA [Bacilli bacterium]|nr:tRNA (adenosine(37)-N6)-dimethylallyltransferase MiaA [Bacilli bacterium]
MNKVIVILGPTGVGKTKLSVSLANMLNGEIINADSTQVYKDLDIATAKVTEEEKQNIPHHLFDIKNIDEDYTVYDYQIDARNKIDEISKKGKIPILVGGTGLYIKACIYNYKFNQENTKKDFHNYTDDELYNLLISIDPNTEIHKNNRKRIERALNYYYSTGLVPSSKEKTDKMIYDCYIVGLTTDRDKLYDIINNRVDSMVKNGLLDEALKIYNSNIRTKAVLTPIGYKELFPYFENKETLETCIDKIKQNSRKYAKRQYTFFNHQMDVNWYNVDYDNFSNTINEVYEDIKKILD